MDISFISSCSCSFCDFFGGTTTRQQVPQGQINMRDARVEEVDHVSDSDSEEADGPTPSFGTGSAHLTVGIFPANQDPTYLLFSNKQVPSPTWHRTIVSLNRNGFFKKNRQEKDSWLYQLTIVSGLGAQDGTQYEQIIQKLMEIDGDPGQSMSNLNVVWNRKVHLEQFGEGRYWV